MKYVFFSIVAKNFLGYGRSFFKNLEAAYPEADKYLFIADEIDGYFDPKKESFNVIEATELKIPEFDYIKFSYEITEYSTAIKPFCIQYLYEQHPDAVIVYMDPDTMVLSRFEEMESAFRDGAELVLTPHICEPLLDGKQPDDFTFLRAGIFNLGFGAFRNSSSMRRFVDWWAERLTDYCTFDLESGIHVDQKWLDYAPAFIDRVSVLRYPGYNVAYWNLPHRNVESVNGRWRVNGQPMRFVHFSGATLGDSSILSRHQNRFHGDNAGPIMSLLAQYHSGALECGQEDTRAWPYTYQCGQFFRNIPYYFRREFRTHFRAHTLRDTSVERFAWTYLMEEDAFAATDTGPKLSRAAVAYHKVRADLQKQFDLDTAEGKVAYLGWLEAEKIDLEYVANER